MNNKEYKICPLSWDSGGHAKCPGERCAWYNKDREQCAIKQIATSLATELFVYTKEVNNER